MLLLVMTPANVNHRGPEFATGIRSPRRHAASERPVGLQGMCQPDQKSSLELTCARNAWSRVVSREPVCNVLMHIATVEVGSRVLSIRVNIPHMSDCAPPEQTPPLRAGERLVHCVKFQKDLPGLASPPWPGELGQRIYENVSAQAWKLWEDRMKMILNEYRLMPWQKEAQELIAKHMEDFFFGESAALPPGYVPQQTK
jgi:Fe-S cluster biosynthesis and repair protein YggX